MALLRFIIKLYCFIGQLLEHCIQWSVVLSSCITDFWLHVATRQQLFSVILSCSVYLSIYVCMYARRFSSLQTAAVGGQAAAVWRSVLCTHSVRPDCGCM